MTTLPGLHDELSDTEYHRRASAVLDAIEADVDRWLQADVVDIDARRTGGMLDLRLPDGSTIVVNLQPPLHELWLAARGGGFHFRHVGGAWRDTRDGSEFFASLSAHASAQARRELRFTPPQISA